MWKEGACAFFSGSNINKLFGVDKCQEGVLIQLYIFKIYHNLETKRELGYNLFRAASLLPSGHGGGEIHFFFYYGRMTTRHQISKLKYDAYTCSMTKYLLFFLYLLQNAVNLYCMTYETHCKLPSLAIN